MSQTVVDKSYISDYLLLLTVSISTMTISTNQNYYQESISTLILSTKERWFQKNLLLMLRMRFGTNVYGSTAPWYQCLWHAIYISTKALMH